MRRGRIYISNQNTTIIYKNCTDKYILTTNDIIYTYLKEYANIKDVVYFNKIRLGRLLSLQTKNTIVIQKLSTYGPGF